MILDIIFFFGCVFLEVFQETHYTHFQLPYVSYLGQAAESFFFSSFRVRFHYGHPDVFDRLFHLTRGGVSKASKVINLSEDIFAGTLIALFKTCFVLDW